MITLTLRGDVWMARWEGEDEDVVRDAFGTNEIPTPYTAAADPALVLRAIATRNTRHTVVLAQEEGTHMNNEPARHARAMVDAWKAAHAIVARTYPKAHYEFSQAGPSIEIQLDATTGLVFGTCDEMIGADVDTIDGDVWEPTGTPVDTDLSSDSEDAAAIACAILKATREYKPVACVDPDHGIGDHPCDEVLGKERAALLREDGFEAAREFDRTHPGYWEWQPGVDDRAAWSFVDYACGHSTPVRGGDRRVAYACPACTALGRPTPYCVCGAQAPNDHNLACPHAERPTRTPVGCPTCEAYRSEN